jgi:hypothetical protein
VAALTDRVAQLVDMMAAVQKENAMLRRQLDVARGVQQHQPYALHASLLPPPPPPPAFSPERAPPAAVPRLAGERTPDVGGSQTCGQDVVMQSPPAEMDQKKARRSLEEGLAEAAVSLSGVSPTDG